MNYLRNLEEINNIDMNEIVLNKYVKREKIIKKFSLFILSTITLIIFVTVLNLVSFI